MIKSTAEMLKKGYLLFPKVLFEEQMKKTKGATGYFGNVAGHDISSIKCMKKGL